MYFRTFTFSFSRFLFSSLFVVVGATLLVYRFWLIEEDRATRKTLWIIDTSLSMAVEDIASSSGASLQRSRLDFARSLVSSTLPSLGGDHAIIAYAREGVLISPLTDDTSHLLGEIANLSVVDLYGGSDLTSALTLAKMLYGDIGTPLSLIVVTDGGSTSEARLSPLPDNFEMTLLGIGSDIGGKIPLGYDASGERRYKYFSGKEIVVRYEEDAMRALADRYDATYRRISGTAEMLPLSGDISKPFSEKQKMSILFCASCCIFFGYFLHPYVQKK